MSCLLGLRMDTNAFLWVQPSESSLLVCSFSPDSTFIAAGCSDNHVYVWHWETAGAQSKSSSKPFIYDSQTLGADAEHVDAENSSDSQGWAQPQEICRLAGHARPVMMLQFSHDGLSIATGSKDGSVQVGACVHPGHNSPAALSEFYQHVMVP